MGNCGDFLLKWNRSALFHSLRQSRLGEGELGLTGKILFDISRPFLSYLNFQTTIFLKISFLLLKSITFWKFYLFGGEF